MQGKNEDAEASFRRALAIKPDSIKAYYGLSDLKSFNKEDGAYSILESHKKKVNLPIKESTILGFTLGKMYEKIGDYQRAFHNYRLGNEFRKRCKGKDFNIQQREKEISSLIDTLDTEFFNQRRHFGRPTELPVFIVGMPRSGTSLVEQVLSSHPQVFGAGELTFVIQMEKILRKGYEEDAFPEHIKFFDENVFENLANLYLSQLRSLSKNAVRITDKMPGNFEYLWIITLLFRNAKIIHCKRNPLDTCLSCYFTDFTRSHGYKNDLRDLGLFYLQYRRLMNHWHEVLPIPILDVQYEELVENQEQISREIVEFCGLRWDDNCLEFYKSQRPVQTASALQVRRKIYKTSVDRWKRYEKYLTPLLETMGDVNFLKNN